MSAQKGSKRVSIASLQRMKRDATPIVCLTAYSAPMAHAMDEHADLILVGDSLGMVLYGFESTLPVTLDMMIAHGQAVMRGTSRAFVVVDMPFATYQESREQAFRNAARVMQDTGCHAVKLEGGAEMADTIRFLTARGIAVLGHIGLMPQSVNAIGGYRVMGRGDDEAARIIADAKAVEAAGAFALVLECVAPSLAGLVAQAVAIPVIGIGASEQCDGQILVTDDMLGLSGDSVPKFVKSYANFGRDARDAFARYADEVRGREFPDENHQYANSNKK